MSNSLVFETFFEMPPEQLFELHTRPEALRRLSPPFPPVRSVEQEGGFVGGTTVRIEIGVWPFTVSWVAELEEVTDGRRFVDVQRRGPFRAWRHVHDFQASGSGALMRDEVTWASKPLFSILDKTVTRRLLRNYFEQRHAALKRWITEEQQSAAESRHDDWRNNEH